jgi:hypothetical protein
VSRYCSQEREKKAKLLELARSLAWEDDEAASLDLSILFLLFVELLQEGLHPRRQLRFYLVEPFEVMGDFLEDHATNLRIDVKPVIGPAMVVRHVPTS